jgi:hypothetical protein
MGEPDFDIKAYFTPSFSGGFGGTQGWKRPYELAHLNLGDYSGDDADTRPGTHQYIFDQDFSSGLRAPIEQIEITKNLYQGDIARIYIMSRSDRDFFDIVDNQGMPGNPSVHGHMMPRIKFPYRAWEINLKGKNDSGFPATPLFRGMRTQILSNSVGDKKITDVQDKIYRWAVEFQSPDRWNLKNDQGAAVWNHRKYRTPDNYHESFDTNHHITFGQAIVRVIQWMNTGSPTTDFPFTYTFPSLSSPPYNAAPYTAYLDAVTLPQPYTIIYTEQNATWDILTSLLNHMGAYEGAGIKYVPVMDIYGNITIIPGGFDKTQSAYEDFRTVISMQKFYYASQGDPNTPSNNLGNGVLCSEAINQASVQFAINETVEYWIRFKLWQWNGSNLWTNVVNVPATGYEHVPYDATNIKGRKDFVFPAQPGNFYYTWTADVVCSNGSFVPASEGSGVYGVAAYHLMASNSDVDTTQLRTFVMTRGMCRAVDIYNNPTTCPDFAAGQCPQRWGIYPDPITSTTVALTGTLTFTPASATVTGSGTAFLSELSTGSLIRHKSGDYYQEVASVESNVSLTLVAAFYDPCWTLAPLTGASVKSGSTASNEVVQPRYGIISGQPLNFNNVSNTGVWNTKCRLVSKKMYNCALNTDSSIREPINVHLEFVDGWTANLLGKYCEYYDVTQDENLIFRVIQQKHTLNGRRLKTELDGFRV